MITTAFNDYNNKNIHIPASPRLSPPARTIIQVYFDGLYQPCNPGGTACFAFTIKNDKTTKHSGYGIIVFLWAPMQAGQCHQMKFGEQHTLVKKIYQALLHFYPNSTVD